MTLINHNLAVNSRGGIWLHEVTGINHAVYSCSKPYHLTKPGDYLNWIQDSKLRAKCFDIADKLAWRANGENKFLRMIQANIEVQAPRAWWSHVDTYKVGTVAQSESTMHNLAQSPLTLNDCEFGTMDAIVVAFNNLLLENPTKDVMKFNLPEGYLQSRVMTLSYATLQTMWYQRSVQEKLGWWKIFFGLYDHLPFPQWVRKIDSPVASRNR